MSRLKSMLMQGDLSVQIGLRFLTAKSTNKFISFISLTAMFGIALGISVLLLIMSVMNGFEQQLKDKLLTVIPHGEVISVNEPIDNWPELISQAQTIDGVIDGAPVISVKGLLQQGQQLSGLKLDGILPSKDSLILDNYRYIDPVAWQQLTPGSNHIILGQGLINKFNFALGDQVTIMVPNPGNNGLSSPKIYRFVLIGAYDFGGEIDSLQAFIHLDDARNIAGLTEGVTGVRFKFDDVFNASSLIMQVGYTVDNYVYLSDWTREQGHLYQDIQLVKLITYIVMVLVVAVASFNIVSSLVMAVQDKESEIAILLTMGLSTDKVMAIFIVQGMVNAILGCVLGGGVGVVIAVNLPSIVSCVEQWLSFKVLSEGIYFVDALPSLYQWQDLALLITATLSISFLATLYPARTAANIKPAVALGQ